MRSIKSFCIDNEPGVGPGPLKEFFEMCLLLFTTQPVTQSTLATPVASIVPATHPSKVGTNAARDELADLDPSVEQNTSASILDATSNRKVNMSEKTELGSGDRSGLYSSLFPLFQQAGEAYPDYIIPRPFQLIGKSIFTCMTSHRRVGRGNRDSNGKHMKGRILNQMALTAFEVVGNHNQARSYMKSDEFP